MEVHHRTAIYRGGAKHDMSNLESLCRDCHLTVTRAEHHKLKPIPGQAEWKREIRKLAGHAV